MSFDCVVIGGGAAGMMAAIQCKENNMQTVIIEHFCMVGVKNGAYNSAAFFASQAYVGGGQKEEPGRNLRVAARALSGFR